MTQLRKFLFWSCLIGIDCFIAFAIGEIWIRSFIPVMNICYDSDPEIGVRFCPNQKTFGYVEKGYSNIFITNSYGFHDIERSIQKASNKYRIAVVGDSLIQGKGVQIEETIPSQLEMILNSIPLSIRFEVMNMAPADDSTSVQILMYEKVVRNFKPDLVICYFMDDFADNIIETHPRSYSAYHVINKKGELEYIAPIPHDTSGPWEQFKKKSRLYRLVANKMLESKNYNNLKELFDRSVFYVKSNLMSNKKKINYDGHEDFRKRICIDKSWPLTLRLIEYFAQIVKADRSEFILVDGKIFHDRNVGTRYKNLDLEKFCDGKSINYLPAYNELDAMSGNNFNNNFFKDFHPKPLGNHKLAEFLAEGIIRINGLQQVTE
jgi:hypothetical protein